jgi:uncharacterized membrane protein HdeD (DUF308 family)
MIILPPLSYLFFLVVGIAVILISIFFRHKGIPWKMIFWGVVSLLVAFYLWNTHGVIFPH